MGASRHTLARMLNRIWQLRGSAPLGDSLSDAAAFSRIERLLAQQKKPLIERSTNLIAFKAPLWRLFVGPGWSAMFIYDRGRAWIDHGPAGRQLRYELQCVHGIAYCLAIGVLAFAFVAPRIGFAEGAKLVLPLFCWLYGMNLVMALLRVPRLFRKAMSEP